MSENIIAPAQDSGYEDRGAIPTLDTENVLGTPDAGVKKKNSVTKFFLISVITAGLLFVLFGYFLYSKSHQKSLEETGSVSPIKETAAFLEKNNIVESDDIEKTKANLKKEEAEKALAQDEATKQELALEQANAATANQTPQGNNPNRATAANGQPAPHVQTPKERRREGSVLFDLADKDSNKQDTTASANVQKSNENDPYQRTAFNNQAPSDNAISSRLNPTVLQARKAGKLPNLKYLLKQGTQIPCSLQTGINTTLPGFILCVTTSDVYSADKKTLLVERGSQIMGEQQANIKQGEARVFALWTRIDTPEGISINIDSPAADQMGYTGIPAFIDNHFWDRFGNAILISMIKDISTIAVERAKKSDTSGSLNISNSQQVGNQMSTEALRNSINIPPTGTVNPATLVEVFVARDISFDNIYTTLE
ncbi:type IV secretion system protein VirB10 [Methylotenera sp.]|uniref:type IV secretion system protein VirB10 n=1 Tax=Methylotenera sp. TaxID=2051956 RepID=UPI002488FA81|nr:type IV secretion system protein VirB10 [Methylotenera sp.]MDI1298619.1 type IV secretion system protein VirB10 [Methylotenera sp.]